MEKVMQATKEPTRVTNEIRIDASKDKVWDVIADLGSVSVWNPFLADSRYTSEAKEGLEASRHCDFPDGGYVEERATEWKPGEAYTLELHEGTVPFVLPASGTLSLVDDGEGTIVTWAFEYDLKADFPGDPQEVERQNREEVFPRILASLKNYVETGEPMPIPEAVGSRS
jgi:uncharacterized protein YndB with AHSA1/START domain